MQFFCCFNPGYFKNYHLFFQAGCKDRGEAFMLPNDFEKNIDTPAQTLMNTGFLEKNFFKA